MAKTGAPGGLTRVAGYGSQLGTLIDAFAAIAPTVQERAQLPPMPSGHYCFWN